MRQLDRRSDSQLTSTTEAVRCLAVSTDGSYVVSGRLDGVVALVRSDDDRRAAIPLTTHDAPVSAVAVHRDGRVVSGAADGSVLVTSLDTPTAPVSLERLPSEVGALAVSERTGELVAGGCDGRVWTWSDDIGAWVSENVRHDGAISGLAVDADGDQLISAGHDGAIRRTTRGPDGHSLATTKTGSALSCVHVDWRSGTILVGDWHYRVSALDLARLDVRASLYEHAGWVTGVALWERTVVSVSTDGSMILWDRTRDRRLLVERDAGGALSGLVIDRHGSAWVGRDARGEIVVHDLRTLRKRSSVRRPATTGSHHTAPIWAVRSVRDGGLVASASADRTIRLWDQASRAPLQVLSGHRAWVNAIACCASGRRLLSGSSDSSLRMWDLESGTSELVMRQGGWINAVDIASDGSLAISGASDGTVVTWDLDAQQLIQSRRSHGGAVTGVALSPDGTTCASCGADGAVGTWQLGTGDAQTIVRVGTIPITSVQFVGSSELLCTALDGTVVAVDAGGYVRVVARVPGRVWSCAMIGDRRSLAVPSIDGTLRIIDRESGRQIHAARGSAPLTSCAGIMGAVATGGRDGRVSIVTLPATVT